MTKDHSKPVGWTCTECGHSIGAGGCYEHSLANQIPIFEPLLTPEPCVIDELPEVVTVVTRYDIYVTPMGRRGYYTVSGYPLTTV